VEQHHRGTSLAMQGSMEWRFSPHRQPVPEHALSMPGWEIKHLIVLT
jgi:hypothetical protein